MGARPDAEDVIYVSLPQDGIRCVVPEQLFLQFCHEEVGIGRSHLGPHCSALYLVVHGVIELKVVLCEDNIEEVRHGPRWYGDSVRLPVFKVQPVFDCLHSFLVWDFEVEGFYIYGS